MTRRELWENYGVGWMDYDNISAYDKEICLQVSKRLTELDDK